MGIKALGYVVIETAKLAEWDAFLADVVGTMRSPSGKEDVALYRIDDRPFRFRIEKVGEDERTYVDVYVEQQEAKDFSIEIYGSHKLYYV